MRLPPLIALAALSALGSAGCARRLSQVPNDNQPAPTPAATAATAAAGDEHAHHTAGASASGGMASADGLPAGGDDAAARLARSPRHAEWAMVPVAGSPADSVRAWVVYPERRTNAPVVVVVHEIFGLTPWIRAVADQLAADGFIAVAPDFLTGKELPGTRDSVPADAARAAIRTLDQGQVQRRIDAVAAYGMRLPAATRKYGVVGFCWGGSVSFNHAVHTPNVGAAVVYYGSSPETARLAGVRAPVLGLYGGDDQRVNATIPAADSAMKAMGKSFVHHIYPGAGHGFLRDQAGRAGANMEATRQGWAETVRFFRTHLGG